jgi:hypothetical protein
VYPELYEGSDPVTLAADGVRMGESWRDTHLRVAHEIVRRVVAREASQEQKALAAAWYVAVAASLAREHDLAGLKDHLEEAREQFPRHADIQFLSGCWAEWMASPIVQASLPASAEKRPSKVKPLHPPRPGTLAVRTNRALAKDLYRLAPDQSSSLRGTCEARTSFDARR